jgi:hypothetical protein
MTLQGVAIDAALRRDRDGEKQQEWKKVPSAKHEIESTGWGV